MKQAIFELPTLAFVVVTRAALAAGAGMLITAGYPEDRRRRIGRILVGFGAITTVPALIGLTHALRRARQSAIARSETLVGASRFPRKADDDLLPPEWDAADIDEVEEMQAEAHN